MTTEVKLDLRGERKGTPVKITGTVGNPFAVSGQWLRGNLHVHLHRWEDSAAGHYRRLGHDFIAAMDHDRIVPPAETEGLLVLPGAEMSPGHLLVFGLDDYASLAVAGVDRLAATERMIRQAAAAGGVSFLAHPLWSRWEWEELRRLGEAGLNGLEVVNSTTTWGHADTGQADQLWHRLLSPHWRPAATGGDDAHGPDALAGGSPLLDLRRGRLGWTGILARERTVAGLLEGLRAGRSYASEGPSFRAVEMHPDGRLVVRCSPCVACHFRGGQTGYGGRTVFAPQGGLTAEEFVFDFASCGYRVKDNLVVVLEDAQRRKAWLSPLSLDLEITAS